jgi:TonB family protein
MSTVRARAGLILMCCSAVLPGASNAQTPPQPIRSGFGAGAYPYGAVFANVDKVVEPDYPATAVKAGIAGEVLLEAVVGPDGRVVDIRVTKALDASSGIDASAVAAVRRWKFTPASISGRKVSVVMPVRVVFHLHPAGEPAGKPFTESGVVPDDVPPADAKTPGLTMPMLKQSPAPKYTSEAMRQKIQGVVEIEVVVGVNGRVTSARVIKSLDKSFGLDSQAIAAARKWTFTPGRLNGVAVPTKVTLSLEFKLH